MITSPAMMEMCEVGDECITDTSSVVIEGSVYKHLNEPHRVLSEHDIENNQDFMIKK